jgi:hypothetical protein
VVDSTSSTGKRKFLFGMISSILYLAVCTFLGMQGLEGGADPTSLGIMFGGIAAGVGGIMSAFVWGNAQEWRAKVNGLDQHLRIS